MIDALLIHSGSRIKDALKAPVVIDLRNIYNPAEMRAHGFTYVSVGRP